MSSRPCSREGCCQHTLHPRQCPHQPWAPQSGPVSGEGRPRLVARAPQGKKGTRSLPRIPGSRQSGLQGLERITYSSSCAALWKARNASNSSAKLSSRRRGSAKRPGQGTEGRRPATFQNRDSPSGAPHPPRAAQPFCPVPLNPTSQDAFQYGQGHNTTPSTKSQPRPLVAAGQQCKPPAPTIPAQVWPGRNRWSSVSPVLAPPLPSFPFQCCEREVLESTL